MFHKIYVAKKFESCHFHDGENSRTKSLTFPGKFLALEYTLSVTNYTYSQ